MKKKHQINILEKFPPIFLLGPPRSGSTLAIQALTEALDVGYISNFHCQNLSSKEYSNEDFKKKIADRIPSDFSSFHGDTKEECAPNECGKWWYQFFRVTPTYVRLCDVDNEKMENFRKCLEEITRAFGKPIALKNLYASLRLQAIGHYLPESLFIVVNRNEVDNGHSLLEARHNVFGNYDTWWSMEPQEISRLKELPAHEQVIEQIRQIHKTIDDDLDSAGVPSSHRFDLNYEEFCKDPNKTIEAIRIWAGSNNCELNRRGSVPLSFRRRDNIRIEKSVYNKMVTYAEKL